MLRTSIVHAAGLALTLALTSCASHVSNVPPTTGTQSDFPFTQAAPLRAAGATRIFVGEVFGGILEFRATDNGDVAPLAVIGGTEFPRGLAVSQGKLYAINSSADKRGHSVLWVYPSTTDGNPPPTNIATCAGYLSTDVAVDSSGLAYVTNNLYNYMGGDITIFPANRNGCIPFSNMTVESTALNEPTGIRIGRFGDIYVANARNNSIAIFAPVVFMPGAFVGLTPKRVIQGPKTHMNFPYALALDAAQNIYVTNGDGESITEYAANANGNATPMRIIEGPNTQIFSPLGLAVDGIGQIYVSNAGYLNKPYGAVTVYAANAKGNVAPIRTIAGANHAKTYYLQGLAVQ